MKIEHIGASDIDEIEFSVKEEKPVEVKRHYVNNKELYAEFVEYHARKMIAVEQGLRPPPLTHKIGQAILDIANRRTNSYQFVGYTEAWKQEMISDAIETCVRYAHNFNPAKSENPFAYITQLVNNALITRIKTEKKQMYIKHKSFDLAGGISAMSDENSNDEDIALFNETSDMYKDYLTFISDYEEKHLTKAVKEEDAFEGILEFLEDAYQEPA